MSSSPGTWFSPPSPISSSNPSEDAPVFLLGSNQTLSWTTTYSAYGITLWTSRGAHTQQGDFLYSATAPGNRSVEWIVDVGELSLDYSNLFYLSLEPGSDPSGQWTTVDSRLFIIESMGTTSSTAAVVAGGSSSTIPAAVVGSSTRVSAPPKGGGAQTTFSTVTTPSTSVAISTKASIPTSSMLTSLTLTTSPSSSSPPSPNSRPTGLSTGASAGIGGGVSVLALLAVTLGILLWYKRGKKERTRRRRRAAATEMADDAKPETTMNGLPDTPALPVWNRGEEVVSPESPVIPADPGAPRVPGVVSELP